MATGRDPADELLRAVGRRIAEVRRAAGLTQEQVAERLNVSPRAYAYLEGGRQNLTLRTMVAVGNVLSACVADLLVAPASQQTKRGRPPRARATGAPSPSPPSGSEEELERAIKLAVGVADVQARSGVEWIADVRHILHAIELAVSRIRGSLPEAERSREFLFRLRELSLDFVAVRGEQGGEDLRESVPRGDSKGKGQRR